MTEQISGPPNYVITSLDIYVSADALVGFFFFNIRDVFHKILCDFAGPEAVQQ